MEQEQNITKRKKHKHILEKDRYTIEQMWKAKCENIEIARIIGCTEKTIEREIERGIWQHWSGANWEYTNVYSADVAQRRHGEKAKNKGRYAKINDAPELQKQLEYWIKIKKYSPEATLNKLKELGFEAEIDISVKTIYNNIDSGELNIKRADLLRKDGWKQDKTKPKRAANNLKGMSIDERPKNVNNREEYGHWEADLVVSCRGGKHALLTLTERRYREEIIVRLPDKTRRSVKRAMDRLERKYGAKFREKFKTITVDNGSEFLDFESLEKSVKCDEKRFKMYYAHAYASWERGTNENANGIIRRFFPKGTDFGKVSVAEIQAVEDWINEYPRPILGGISAKTALARMVA